ncbi:MAG: hypothetical protein K2X47_03350 [Bdellovibrionales bacterium]|nr:hypothetical protein [Bdellovibrionales bacterium]
MRDIKPYLKKQRLGQRAYLVRSCLATTVDHASLELRPIRIQIKEFELFAAVNGGVLAYQESKTESPGESFFYGAGLGANYNNSVGLRADMKSSRTFPTITSLSLIGFY